MEANPVIFRIGDLVEIQMTASAVPIKHGRYRMILTMRSLAMIDCEYSEVRLYS
jgi:hypothetical protein